MRIKDLPIWKRAKKQNTIVVLNDGETYTSFDHCKIMILTDEGMEVLEDADPRELKDEHIIQTFESFWPGEE